MPRRTDHATSWAYTPLCHQMTQYDCGTMSFLNAILFLLPRREIPLELVKYVIAVTGDRHFGPDGDKGGTSGRALSFLAGWANDYAGKTGLPIRCEAISGGDVSLSPGARMREGLEQGAVAVAGCCLGADHYVLVTGLVPDDGETRAIRYVELWDPYYDVWPLHDLRGGVPVGVSMVDNRPFECNRKVEAWVLEEPAGTPYTLNAISGRDAVLVWKTGEGAN